jgi:hypothetical protein
LLTLKETVRLAAGLFASCSVWKRRKITGIIPDGQRPQLPHGRLACRNAHSGSILNGGELEGELEQGTEKRVWLISIESLSTLRAKRGTGRIAPATEPEIAETIPEAMRDLALRLENRASEAAELRTRLELTAQTQSTIDQERIRLQEQLQRKEERVEELQRELEAERPNGFWRRLFRSG